MGALWWWGGLTKTKVKLWKNANSPLARKRVLVAEGMRGEKGGKGGGDDKEAGGGTNGKSVACERYFWEGVLAHVYVCVCILVWAWLKAGNKGRERGPQTPRPLQGKFNPLLHAALI